MLFAMPRLKRKKNIKIVERGQIDTPIIQKKHERSLSWFGKGTSVKRGDAKLAL
jgi:hypothetical protein